MTDGSRKVILPFPGKYSVHDDLSGARATIDDASFTKEERDALASIAAKLGLNTLDPLRSLTFWAMWRAHQLGGWRPALIRHTGSGDIDLFEVQVDDTGWSDH